MHTRIRRSQQPPLVDLRLGTALAGLRADGAPWQVLTGLHSRPLMVVGFRAPSAVDRTKPSVCAQKVLFRLARVRSAGRCSKSAKQTRTFCNQQHTSSWLDDQAFYLGHCVGCQQTMTPCHYLLFYSLPYSQSHLSSSYLPPFLLASTLYRSICITPILRFQCQSRRPWK